MISQPTNVRREKACALLVSHSTAAMDEAEAARESGNELFKAQSYAEASQKYVDAMVLLQKTDDAAGSKAARQESLHKCRLNRAACLMKLQGYAAARRECEAVLRDDEAHAKAHFRLGQAAEALGELSEAQRSLTTAIRLSPQLREPRDMLDALKARLKARPNLDNTMQDLRLVEERALRALHHADLPRARQQMELLLKVPSPPPSSPPSSPPSPPPSPPPS